MDFSLVRFFSWHLKPCRKLVVCVESQDAAWLFLWAAAVQAVINAFHVLTIPHGTKKYKRYRKIFIAFLILTEL